MDFNNCKQISNTFATIMTRTVADRSVGLPRQDTDHWSKCLLSEKNVLPYD